VLETTQIVRTQQLNVHGLASSASFLKWSVTDVTA
jgi:hypothetical protein